MVEILKDLERLRREHHICDDDCWCSCPMSGHCCDPERSQADCDCGAYEHNAILDGIIERVRALRTGHTTVVVELDATEAIKKIDRHFFRIIEMACVRLFLPDHKDYRYMWE